MGTLTAALLPILVVLLRRVPLLVALVLALPARAQVDAEHVEVYDAGAFPTLWEGDLGPAWGGAVAVSLNHAHNLVVFEENGRSEPLLEGVLTRTLAASLNFGGVLRVGFAYPRLRPVNFDGWRRRRGLTADIPLWLAVPLTHPDNALRASWTVRGDLPVGPGRLFLGDPGAVSGIVALQFPAGTLEGLVDIGLTFHEPVPIPGNVWRSHWTWGVGLRAEPAGPSWVVWEAQGEAPIAVWSGDAVHYPLQTLLTAGATLSRLASLGAGAGTGIGRGLGSPDLRLLALVDLRAQELVDHDGDGIHDLADLCRREPEDRDGYRDGDGCPDPDNDGDGFLDAVDRCPRRPESFDGYEDDDGCPEDVVHLTVRVEPERPAQTVWVSFDGGEPIQALGGEAFTRTLPTGPVSIEAGAPGHRTRTRELQLGATRALHEVIALEALRTGRVHVTARGADGEPLEATVLLPQGEAVATDATLELPAGPADLVVSAPGHLDGRLRAEVPDGETLELSITLRPTGVSVDGDRIEVGDTLGFALDEATPSPEGEATLGELAAWLASRPDIELLRIEGHADASGTSRHNHELSIRRAEAVRAALVALGIAPERLEAIGSGESQPRGQGDRRVEFVVLIWRDP